MGATVASRATLAAAILAVAAVPASAAVSLVPAYTDSPANPVQAPISVTAPPGDATRLFVTERGGRVRLAVGGVMLDAPFLDITSSVSTAGEGGLLSIAFPPDYATSGLFYAYFVDKDSPNGDIRIEEFKRNVANPNVADPASRRLVLEIQHDSNNNHYGGQLQFGPDGYLYAGTGDGGGGGDPPGNAQNTSQVLGKLLRIDPRQDGAAPYSIPAGNPYAGQGLCNLATGAHPCPEIAAYGLRNPFRFSFDRANGAVLIGDVGQSAWEEVDYAAAGSLLSANFGWNCYEGPGPYSGAPAVCPAPGYVAPIFSYANPGNASAAISGGVVVRDPALTPLSGRYLYGDFYEGAIRSLLPTTPAASDARAESLPNVPQLVAFGEDASARVYVVSLAGAVQRLACDASCPPPPPDGGGTGGGSGSPPGTPGTGSGGGPGGTASDSRAPVLSVRAARVQDVLRRRQVRLSVRCDEPCIVRVSATLRLSTGGARIARSYRLRGTLMRLTADKRSTIALALPARLRRVLLHARRASVALSVRARDAADNLTTKRLAVRVRLPQR